MTFSDAGFTGSRSSPRCRSHDGDAPLPAHTRQIRAGKALRDVTTLVPRVLLPALSSPANSSTGMATGACPSASTPSWLPHPTTAILFGAVRIVISPYACVIVTGNASPEPLESDDPERSFAELDTPGLLGTAGEHDKTQAQGEKGTGKRTEAHQYLFRTYDKQLGLPN